MGPVSGKNCLVTGATSGIGAVTARSLARLGGTVVVAGRHPAKCARQVERIKQETGNPRIEALVADLSSQTQVRRLASEVRSRFSRLDVLVNNAGAYYTKREVSADGLEMTFALNHLGHFLLTSLLLESLSASPSARIVNVSSSAHMHGKIDFDDLQVERHYDRLVAYGQSKLANLLFTYELSRRLQGSRVTANAFDPGHVATNLGGNNGWLRVKLRNLLRRNLLSPERGAETGVYLASSPDVEGISGRYFRQCTAVQSSDASYDVVVAERLWRISAELTGFTCLAPSGIP